MRSLFDTVLALPLTLLPRRYWQSFDLPVLSLVPISGFVMLFAGFAIGIRGYFGYLERLRDTAGLSILDISQQQVQGTLPETAAVSAAPGAVYALGPVAFAFFSPVGLFATYLVLSSLVRIASSYIDEPLGDPILTGLDAVARQSTGSRRVRSDRAARTALEGKDEPDRLHEGQWAGLTGVDFVVVSARRKPGWDKGTAVITSDGWFTLGEPFDRPTPNGLRTIYPLTRQTAAEVVRRSVSYELPSLRQSPTLNRP